MTGSGVQARSIRRELLRPRWILTTLLVLAAAAVMVRLGFWQLDRLEQRRAYNAQVRLGMSLAPLDLNTGIPRDLPAMEYRTVSVTGRYDFSQQVLLRNQALDGQAGYHVLTPLVITGAGKAILVDRGFILLKDNTPEALARYDQLEPGEVTVTGQLRRSQPEPRVGGVPDPTLSPNETRLSAWNFINLERIRLQISPELLDVYLLAAPDPALELSPVRIIPEVDLSEGSHAGYAGQWFTFAGLLLAGYPIFVRSQLMPKKMSRR
jgi:surfeit locus 1 family protein